MSFDFSVLKRQRVDFIQNNKVLAQSHKKIEVAKQIIDLDTETSFTAAYEAMLKTTLALMLSEGYRPRMHLGHHKTLIEFAKHILGAKFVTITDFYETMRLKRNKLVYDILIISKSEAKNAIAASTEYFLVVENNISKNNPQQKLWRPE